MRHPLPTALATVLLAACGSTPATSTGTTGAGGADAGGTNAGGCAPVSVAGLPHPMLLAQLDTPPLSMAVGALNVYAAPSTGGLDVIPRTPSDGGTFASLGGGLLVESVVASTGDSVVVAGADDTIDRLSTDGTQSVIAQGQTGSGFSDEGAVAVDASHVYWLGEGPVEKGATPTMGFVRRSDPDGTNLLDIAAGQRTPHTLLVDGGMVYWAEMGSLSSEGDFQPDGTMRRTPIGGGTVDTLASGLLTPSVLARRGTDLWLRVGSDLVRLPDGGKPEVVYAGGWRTVIGVSHAYVVTTLGQELILLRLPLAGGCAEPVADLGSSPPELVQMAMATDDQNVYLGLDTGEVAFVSQ